MVVGAALLMGCGEASMRSAVRGVTYGEDRSATSTNYPFRLYATLKPLLDRPYRDCVAAQEVLRSADISHLAEAGQRLNEQLSPDTWAEEARRLLPTAQDPLLVLALAEAAMEVADVLERVEGSDSEVVAAAERAFAVVTEQLGDPAACAPLSTDRGTTTLALGGGAANGAYTAGVLFELFSLREEVAAELETAERNRFLSISEFSAASGTSVGALLAALSDLYFTNRVTPEMSEAWTHFSQNKLLLEHYQQSGAPPYRRLGYGPDEFAALVAGGRLPQAWALGLLQEYFTDVAEPEVVCVQPGSVVRLVGQLGPRHPGLMRFDPLDWGALRPFLSAAAPALLNNGFRRIVHSVEAHQNVAIGLDELVCRAAPEGEAACLAASVMASVVQPVFAQPLNRVRTGLNAGEQCGIWLDAGVRTGLPAYQALKRSRPRCGPPERARVIAVSNARFGGVPSDSEDALLSIAIEAIGEMGHQLQKSEANVVLLAAALEQARYDALALLSNDPECSPRQGAPVSFNSTASDVLPADSPLEDELCSGALGELSSGAGNTVCANSLEPTSSRPIASTASLETKVDACRLFEVLYVPESVPVHLVARAGYRFDPFVMRGLFVYGRLHAATRILGRSATDPKGTERAMAPFLVALGWAADADLRMRIERRAETHLQKLATWKAFVSDNPIEEEARRLEEGRARFDRGLVSTCCEAPGLLDAPWSSDDRECSFDGEFYVVPDYYGGKAETCR